MSPTPPTEAEATVPPATAWQEIQADVKKILAHVGGSYDDHGEHHPGLSHRVKRLETIVNWILGVGTAVLTAVLAAISAGHIGGKHP